MYLDVVDLRSFYYRTRLGRSVQAALRAKILEMWPAKEQAGLNLAGFGFAVPLMRPYLAHVRRGVALMPGPQGVMRWPAGQDNVACLCEETLWPLKAGQLDRLIMLHGLEVSEHGDALLQEISRVLAPGGRALIVVPNRASIWARHDATPFGFGRPYSRRQLEDQLRRAGFSIGRGATALYAPPSDRRFWRRSAGFFERLGQKVPGLISGGVLIAEIEKTEFAPMRPGLTTRVQRPLKILGPALPRPEPARATSKVLRKKNPAQ